MNFLFITSWILVSPTRLIKKKVSSPCPTLYPHHLPDKEKNPHNQGTKTSKY